MNIKIMKLQTCIIIIIIIIIIITTTTVYGPFIQYNPGEPVLSHLLEQPLDLYEPDVLPLNL